MADLQAGDDLTCQELRRALDEAIGSLPEKYRAPIVLCYLERKTYDEAARELGCPKISLAKHLARAKELLRRKLERRGITLSAAALTTSLAEMGSAAPMPALLTIKTIKAGALVAAGKSVTSCLSTGAIALAEEAVAGMLGVKGKLALMVLVLGLAAGGAGWAGGGFGQKVEQAAPAQAPLAKERGPAKKEPAFDQFGDPLPEGAVARLGARRFRHDGYATALAFIRAGKTLVGRTNSGVVLWDAASGQEQKRLNASLHSLYYSDAAGGADDSGGMDVSPDETTLALSDYGPNEEPKISLWNLVTGEKTRTLSLPKGEKDNADLPCFIRLSFSRDDKSLAWGNAASGKVVIFDCASGQVRLSLGGRNHATIYNFAISPDSKTVAVAVCSSDPKALGHNHCVQIWDLATGKVLRTVHELPDKTAEVFVGKLVFSGDGTTLAFGIKDRIYFDAVTGNKLGNLEAKMGQVNNLAFAPDAKTLVSGSARGKTRVWDLRSAKVRHTLDGGTFGALAPDGKTVALVDAGAVRIWDVNTGTERFPEYHAHKSWIMRLVFSPDSSTLVSTEANGPTVFWDVVMKREKGTLPWQGAAFSFSFDGKMLATDLAGKRNKVRVWHAMENKLVMELEVQDAHNVASCAFSRDGRKIFTLSYNRGQDSIHQWDLATGKRERASKYSPKSYDQVLAPDGKAFAALDDGLVIIHDTESGRTQQLPALEKVANWVLMPSPDSRVLACGTGSSNRGVRLWELLTGKEIMVLTGNKGTGGGIAWSPDGVLVAGGDRRTLQYVDLGFTPDRRMNWLSMQPAMDHTVRVWDSATGRQLARFGGFDSDVIALSFSPDGAFLVAGLADSTILAWDVAKVVPRKEQISRALLETCWTDLGASNTGKAYQAIGTLVASSKDSVPFLRGRIRSIAVPNEFQILKWIGDLNGDEFAVRQAATKGLENAGDQVTVSIRKALKANTRWKPGAA
jgi:WD40 repeat protein